MRINKRNISLLILFTLILCVFSFILGVYSLRNGTLRKIYDIFFAIENVELRNKVIINESDLPKLDTLELKMSKKKRNQLIKIRSEKINSLLNIVTFGFKWDEERPWLKSRLIQNEKIYLEGKIKLIGLNSDHFREAENWSLRVKLQENDFINELKKFNLLVPYTRGYFIDGYYNSIYKNEGGLFIKSKPIITRLLNTYKLQLFEPFFSKELLEAQQRKDGLIFTADSLDSQNVRHLRLVHPNNLSELNLKQLEIFKFYDAKFKKEQLRRFVNLKQYAFLVAVGINIGGEPHHLINDNLHFYADPINGELLPFLREISTVEGNNNGLYSYNTIKSGYYKLIDIKASEMHDFKIFDKWVNYYSLLLNKIDIEKNIQNDEDLFFQYYYVNKYYPWSFAYKKRIRVRINFDNTENTRSIIAKNLVSFTGNNLIKDTIITFTENDSIIFSKKTNLLVKNSTIIFSGKVGTSKDFLQLNIKGDSLSTIIFTNSNIDLSNSHFTGFGNKIKNKNREVTAAITFYNSKIHLKNCSFQQGYSGDDLVNIIRSSFIIDKIKLTNSKSDGLDLDYSNGTISNSTFNNCGNDGIDAGNSNVKLLNVNISNCGDKGLSIGEKSVILLYQLAISNSEIGIGLKDGSILSFKKMICKKNHLDLAAYGKKGQYEPAVIQNIDNSFLKMNYLIEPDVNVPKKFTVTYTKDIIKYMYGKRYGKASIR
jgi:hypothetical protein